MTEEIYTINSLTDDYNRKAYNFFNAVNQEVLDGVSLKDTVQVILVAHAYENILPCIQSIADTFTLAGIIFKNSTDSIRPEYGEYLRDKGFSVLTVKKSDFKRENGESNGSIQELLGCLDPDKKTIIMDHGGYFAFSNGEFLSRNEFSKSRVVAISEYAANGEERWNNIRADRPILSIGYSAIKEASDFAAAESVVEGSIWFAQNHNLPLLAKTTSIGLIGHGRLGSAIAKKFSNNYVPVMVYDKDELKISGLRHIQVVSRKKIIQRSDVIFCATGNHAILPGDLASLKDGVVIFTVTSPDDELNLQTLINQGILVKDRVINHAHSYIVKETGKRLWLPFNGESSNIIFSSSVNDPTILQPMALHTIATIKAYQNLNTFKPGVHRIPVQYDELVARVWNKHFNPDYNGIH